MTEFLVEYRQLFALGHLICVAIGAGAATVTDIFFFRFLKNFKISPDEARIMRFLSRIIWIGLAGLIITGLGLYLADPADYNNAPKFLVKMIIIAVILINGIVLNFYISPRLTDIEFPGKTRLRSFRRIAFASGAISFTSWYSALILGASRGIKLPFSEILMIYAGILLLAILGSQAMEFNYARRAKASVQ